MRGLLVFFAFGFHRLDIKNLVSVAQHLDIEHDFVAGLQLLDHHLFGSGEFHRHRSHEAGDRVVLNNELTFSNFHNDAVSDEGAFAGSGWDGCGGLGRRFRRRGRLRFGFRGGAGDGESYQENCKYRELQKAPPVSIKAHYSVFSRREPSSPDLRYSVWRMRKLVRDAVHGDIELGPLEMELIDTPEFQRLRGIKQLGTAYLIYPSAMHTRFEHSIGTSWMAHRFVEAVRRSTDVSNVEEELIRAAALLHDITHIPFGHTLEDERRVLPRHDQDSDRFAYFLEDSSVGAVLRSHGVSDDVRAILSGRAGLASDIVSGAISADLLDYLRRDTYFCGLSQHYDDRIFQSFEEEGGRLIVRLEKHGVLRRDALSEMVNLLRIRYTLSERVYFHHTKLASGAMISKTVEMALAQGLDPVRLRTLKDDTLLWVLGEDYSEHAGIAHILDRLETRKLYKPAYVLTVSISEERQKGLEERFHFNSSEREAAEQAIATTAGLDPYQVIVYCPSLGMSLPEAEVPVRLDGGEVQPLSGANNSEIRILKEKHRALWKFLVLIDRSAWDLSEAVCAVSEEYFGIPAK